MRKTTNIGKFYYCFPQTVAMVGVQENIMPAAWHSPISAEPPLYGILISPRRYTYELLLQENGFTINFLEVHHAPLSAQTGSTSGKTVKKLAEFDIPHTSAEKVNGPILLDSYAAYECVKYEAREYGDHFLFIGEIVMLHFREDVIGEDRLVNEKKIKPMLYFGKDRYLTIDPNTLSIHNRE